MRKVVGMSIVGIIVSVLILIGIGSIQNVEGQSYSSVVKALIYDATGRAISSTNGLYTTLATTIAGEDIPNDVMKVEQRFGYINIVLAAPTTTVVKSGAGFLHAVNINKTANTGVITCYDNTAASGTVIGTITQPAAVLASQVSMIYDVTFSLGLTCVTSVAAQDITISYR